MPLTVAAIEEELLTELGPYLATVGLDAATADGTNPSLRGPIRRAVLHLGGSTAGPIAVADADLLPFEGWQVERLLDVAKLRAFEICWGNWPKVSFSAGGNSQQLSDLADRLKAWIDFLTKRIAEPYGLGVPIGPGASARGLIDAGRCVPYQAGPLSCYPTWRRWPC